jgi:hypothetical protein
MDAKVRLAVPAILCCFVDFSTPTAPAPEQDTLKREL